MQKITRFGTARRWSDVVIYGGVARWVEVAEDTSLLSGGQIDQVLRQIDATLRQIGSDKSQVLEVIIFLADLAEMSLLNERWDAWVMEGHPPIRACLQVGLAGGCRVEMVVTAAVEATAPEVQES